MNRSQLVRERERERERELGSERCVIWKVRVVLGEWTSRSSV